MRYDSEKTAVLAAKAAAEKLAINVKLFNVSDTSDIVDYFLICSGNNDRHVRAIVDNIDETLMKKAGIFSLRMEGYPDASWIVLDYGDVMMHIFNDITRDRYMLEELWADAMDMLWKDAE
ncbi:MAG: ribosome silencing factor [Oligoflexia bacterium]|nr:ribosome silencing factor [Oligoflexia bacterium]